MTGVRQAAEIFSKAGRQLGGGAAYALGFNVTQAGQKLSHLPLGAGRVGERLAATGRNLEEAYTDYVAASYKVAALGRVMTSSLKSPHS